MKEFKLNKSSRQSLISLIGSMSLDNNKEYYVNIKEKSNRSTAQNKLYWDLITEIGNYLGYTSEEMHGLLAYKYLSHKIEVMDEEVTVVPSTSRLTVKEFNDYIKQITNFADGLGFKGLHGI